MNGEEALTILKTMKFDDKGCFEPDNWYEGIGEDYNEAIKRAIDILERLMLVFDFKKEETNE